MEIDVARVLGSSRARCAILRRTGKPASTVTLTRLYDTSVDDLWDALTSKERIPRWFLPVEGDLKLGGRYQLKGNAGGTITACTPPSHFAATWEFGGGTSWIDVNAGGGRGKARMTLEHTAIIEDHWNQFGPGAVGIGWDLAVTGLERHLATGRVGRPCDGRGMDGFAKRQGVHELRAASFGVRRMSRAASIRPRQRAVGPDHRFLSRRDPRRTWRTRAQEADARLRSPLPIRCAVASSNCSVRGRWRPGKW